MDSVYQYKAFISYRHTAHDKVIAEKLQKRLESYKPPKDLEKEKWKIFRDETELSSHSDLSDRIKDALRKSEFLIVICSETTKASKWCREEIDYFKSLHMGSTDRIIPLVTGGNPEDVFPPALLTTTVFDEETGEYIEREVEPLAANVSATTLKGSLSALKTEFLRVAAPLLYCGYDNLFLRDRRRRRKRIFAAGASVTAAVVLFTLYTLTMLMKISTQNADLEKKNYELDLSNSNLTTAYSNLDSANAELTKINTELDTANSDLVKSNDALDTANTDLKNANSALDTSNAELSRKKKDLESVNSELQKTNTELDNSNAELQKTNTALDDSNAELVKVNTALDTSNTQLQKSNKALDESNIELKNTNEALEAAKKNAEDREKEAIAAKEIAEIRRKEAETAKIKADAAAEAARIAEQEAKDARDAEELQRKKAEAAKEETEKKNRELMKANAEISAANADSIFSYNYDRIGALQTAISTPLYEEEGAEVLPSTTHFLNKALYSMTVNNYPRLSYALEAQSYIKDFWFSPENNYIAACGISGFVDVFDVLSGEMVYKVFDDTILDARLIDESHLVIVNYSGVRCVDFITGEEEWNRPIVEISRRSAASIESCAFSDDAAKVAVWNTIGYFAFLDAHTGETIDTYKTTGFMSGFYDEKRDDFSDGVHFSTACYKGDSVDGDKYIISYDLSKKRYSMIPLGKDRVAATRNVGSGNSVAVALYTMGDDGVESTTLNVYNRLNAKRQTSVVLYNGFLTDLKIVDTVYVEVGDTLKEYAAVIGTCSHDNRSVVCFVDIKTGETICYYANAKVMGAEGREDRSGRVDIYTENGNYYWYDLLTGDGVLGKTTYDSETSHADGSVKIVWTDGDLVAALGKNGSKIFIYRVEAEPDIEVIFEEASAFTQVLESERYIVAVNEDSINVFSRENKEFLYQMDRFSYLKLHDEIVLYRDTLVLVNRNDNTVYAYSLDDHGALKWQHKIDDSDSIESYSLDVSEDGETLTAVTPNTVCRITGDGNAENVSHLYTLPSADRTYWYVSANPDGNSVIVRYCVKEIGQELPYHFYWCLYDFNAEEWRTLAEEKTEVLVFEDMMTAFSEDHLLAALLMNDRIAIVRTDSGKTVNEILLSDEIVSAVSFEPGGDRLLVLYENSYLKEYDVNTGAELHSVMVPAKVFQKTDFNTDYREVTLMMNDAYNEALIFNDQYACFIDLSYFEVVSETLDTMDMIYGFIENTQQLIVFDDYCNLVLIPHYPKEYLFERAGQLLNSVG